MPRISAVSVLSKTSASCRDTMSRVWWKQQWTSLHRKGRLQARKTNCRCQQVQRAHTKLTIARKNCQRQMWMIQEVHVAEIGLTFVLISYFLKCTQCSYLQFEKILINQPSNQGYECHRAWMVTCMHFLCSRKERNAFPVYRRFNFFHFLKNLGGVTEIDSRKCTVGVARRSLISDSQAY